MKVYSVRDGLYAIDGDLVVRKLIDLPNPYFYIDEYEYKGEGELVDGWKTFGLNARVYKIKTRYPKDVIYLRRKYDKTYEADIRYINRLFIDNVLELAGFRKDIFAFFDIETDSHGNVISIAFGKMDGDVEWVNGDEKDVIEKFTDWLIENNIVYLLAWNGLKFDFPIIDGKVGKYLSEEKQIYWDLIEKLDYMMMYDRFIGTERKALDYVAKRNGLEGKKVVKVPIWQLPEDKLKEYNIRDVEIMIEIEEKKQIIPIAWELAKITNLMVSEVVPHYLKNGKEASGAKTIIDALLLRRAKEKKIVLPTAKKDERKSFKGAYIWAKEGLYEWVGVYDLNSLYPSIILNEKYGYDIVLELLKELYSVRFKYKNKWKENGDLSYYYKQLAYKTMINAFYGVTSLPSFRLYNLGFAKSVTAKGREIITSIKKYVQERLGYNVVYMDTDSVYVVVGFDDVKEYKYIEKKLNQFIAPYTLDWEKTYRRLLITTKKRYAGKVVVENGKVLEKPKYDVKGLEVVRGDVFDLLREVEWQILIDILEKGYNSERVNSFLMSVYDDLFSGKYDDKLIYVKGVKSNWSEYKVNTPQLRAWKKIGDENLLFVEYVWVKGGDVEPIINNVIPRNIDYRKYWGHIIDAIDRIRNVFVEQRRLF